MKTIALALPLLAFAVLSGAAGSVHAQTMMTLDGRLLVENVEHVQGSAQRRILTSPAEARSGDTLVFLVRYRNAGAKSLPGYDIVVPVPRGVQILPDRQDVLRISADGGHSWSKPDAPFRFDSTGKLRRADEAAPTHVRVRLSDTIAPGTGGTIAYRGKLL